MRQILNFSMLTLFFIQTLAWAGDSVGNPNGNLAYDEEAQKAVAAQFNMKFLQLSGEEIKDRDDDLEDLYDYYKHSEVSRMINLLEDVYGVNIYHYQSSKEDLYEPNLDDKKGVMDCAIRFYTGYGLEGTPFEHADSRVLPGKGCIVSDYGIVFTPRISGSEPRHYGDSNMTERKIRFQLFTEKHEDTCFLSFWKFDRLYSSTGCKNFVLPGPYFLGEALKQLQLKGLDATVVFLASELQPSYGKNVSYKVIYPARSPLAPIPHPIVFLSASAGIEEIKDMLSKNASQIYAYNQAFDKELLPTITEMNNLLKKYPALLPEVEAAANRIAIHNAKEEIMMHAFFILTYAIISGALTVKVPPLGLAAVLGSPVLYPLYVEILKKLN